MSDKCPICGSNDITLLEKSDLRSHYHCQACDHDFYTLNKKIVSHNTTELNAEEVFKKNIDATVRVSSFPASGNNGSTGTGVIVDHHHIITNAHVILLGNNKLPGKDIYMRFYKDDTKHYLKVVCYDSNIDLAILYSEEYLDQMVTISNIDHAPGEPCFAIGNSRGEGLAITEGIISDNRRMYQNNPYVLSSALITHGNSGGPLFDKYGELIGINSLTKPNSPGMNYALCTDIVEDYLKHNV